MIDKEKIALATEQFKNCSPLFIALGDSHRQKLCMDLASSGEDGLNVAELSGKSILSRPAISHHLKVLKDAGIVEPLKKGTQVFYRLRLRENFTLLKKLMLLVEEILDTVDDEKESASAEI
ncbi:MAG: metalloregulator ArsR/SmtB family transcription factor [Treponema sp.]|nr:metalloregulator ArsR/SmtB family transcription factor [Treponema sp.]